MSRIGSQLALLAAVVAGSVPNGAVSRKGGGAGFKRGPELLAKAAAERANGAEERIAKAQEKRARKAGKRRRNA